MATVHGAGSGERVLAAVRARFVPGQRRDYWRGGQRGVEQRHVIDGRDALPGLGGEQPANRLAQRNEPCRVGIRQRGAARQQAALRQPPGGPRRVCEQIRRLTGLQVPGVDQRDRGRRVLASHAS